MTDGNTPEGTALTALTTDEAANQIEGLLSDDLETDTGAPEDNPEDDFDDADDAEDLDADEAEDDEAEADDDEDDADEDVDETDAPAFSDETEIELEDGSKVTLADLKKGNLRQADYTRKTQEVAEIRREFEAKSSQIDGAAQQLVNQFQVLEQMLAMQAPQRPTAQMAQDDPFGYQEAQARFMEFQEQMQHVSAQMQQASQFADQRKQQERQVQIQNAMRDLIAWNPDFADAEKRRAFGQKLAADVEVYGFNKSDLDEITDPRVIKALADAAKYQALQKSKPKAVRKAQKAPPVTTPKQRQSQQGQMKRMQRKQFEKLRQTGRAEDAAALIKNLI